MSETNKKLTAYQLAENAKRFSKSVLENEESYADSIGQLNEQIRTYGGMQKLEDNVTLYASQLKKTEDRIKNYLARPTWFKKKVNVKGDWTGKQIDELKDLEEFVGGRGALYFEGVNKYFGESTFAKIDKNGDVVMNHTIGRIEPLRITTAFSAGALGTFMGGMSGAFYSLISNTVIKSSGEPTPVIIDSLPVAVPAIIGGLGLGSLAYYGVRTLDDRVNPLSECANNLEENLSEVKEILR